jgi:hypothetical protein
VVSSHIYGVGKGAHEPAHPSRVLNHLNHKQIKEIAPLLPPPFSKTENRGGVLCFSDRGGDHYTCTLCVRLP